MNLLKIAASVAATDPKKIVKPHTKGTSWYSTIEMYWEDEKDQEITFLVDVGVYPSGGNHHEVEFWNFRTENGFTPMDEAEFFSKIDKDRAEQKAIDEFMSYHESRYDEEMDRRGGR